MLTKKALQQADAAVEAPRIGENRESIREALRVEDPAKGGYNQELGVQRRPSVSSTGTGDDLSHLSSRSAACQELFQSLSPPISPQVP